MWNICTLGKFFTFISFYKICVSLVEILENLLFHVLSNYACKFAINLFPITWGHFKMLIYSIFYWKYRNFGKSKSFSCTVQLLSNYACKFAINLFPITWGPFQNVNLLYFLLKIQISNGCNVLNIAGNPIKDIIVNLSFLSSGSKVVQNIPCQLGIWWKFWKIYFFMYCPIMHANLP